MAVIAATIQIYGCCYKQPEKKDVELLYDGLDWASISIWFFQEHRKQGRTRWAKHSRLQPYEVFFCGTLKIRENLAQQIPPRLQYSGTLPDEWKW